MEEYTHYGKQIIVDYYSICLLYTSTHGINVGIADNRISIDFHVIVSYGVSISAVSDNLIESVKYRVEEFTGMEIEKINIFVEGVKMCIRDRPCTAVPAGI